MKILVLGAGLQGTACAFDLLEHSDACVTIADARIDELPPFIRPYLGERLVTLQLDARDTSAMRSAMRGADAVLCALPYYFNFRITQLAVEVGTHYADLGGNTEIVRQQEALDGSARDKGLCITPDCGLAPGMVNILAAARRCSD